MSFSNAEMVSLGPYLDDLVTRDRPNYVDISAAVPSHPLPKLIPPLASSLFDASRRLRSMDPSSRCLIFFDCGEFDVLITALDDLSLAPLRTLFYIVREGEFLQLSGEAYVRNMTSNFSLPSGVNVTYACFRDLDALENSWEFSAGFYLWQGSAK